MRYCTILFFTLVLLLGSCNVTDSDCRFGYVVTDFDRSIQFISYDSNRLNELELSDISEDEISSKNYAINIDPIEAYINSTSSAASFSFLASTAYACSPPDTVTEARIESISITSDESFSDDFPPESDMTNIFDVITTFEGENTKIQSVVDYNEKKRVVPNNMILVLNTPPESSKNISFYVTLELENVGFRYFSFKTPYISVFPE